MLKQPSDILREAIAAYAAGTETPPVTLPEEDRRYIVAHLADVAAGSTAHDSVMSAIVNDVKTRKQEFLARELQAHAKTRTDMGLDDPEKAQEIRTISFPAFWAEASVGWAESFAERAGHGDGCRTRGINGLLEVRAVRVAVAASLSLVHVQMVENRAPALGDGYDLWHALMASTADAFVTFDSRLAANLSRMPVDHFRVFTEVGPLLEGC